MVCVFSETGHKLVPRGAECPFHPARCGAVLELPRPAFDAPRVIAGALCHVARGKHVVRRARRGVGLAQARVVPSLPAWHPIMSWSSAHGLLKPQDQLRA